MGKLLKLFRAFSATTLIVSSVSTVQALESDQFMTFGREIPDISDALNEHVNQTVQDALAELALKPEKVSCREAGYFAVKKFRGFFIHKIEKWLMESQGDNLYPTASTPYPAYFRQSIYNFPFSTIARFFPMGRNLNFNGVILGTDKVAHFLSTGLRYFNLFNELRDKGLTDEEATKKAIRFGITLEKTYLGLWPAGVFSFGDLEANYQGLQMNIKFCEGETPYLEKSQDGHWILKREIDLKDYLNPYMDETFNKSFYGKFKWLKVKPMLKKYCEKKSQIQMTERVDFYKSVSKKSFNVLYVEELESLKNGSVPDRSTRSFQSACK